MNMTSRKIVLRKRKSSNFIDIKLNSKAIRINAADKGSPEDVVNRLRQLFFEAANSINALQMKKYMKNNFEFFGIKSPLRKTLTQQLFKEYNLKNMDLAFTKNILQLVWKENEREMQYFGTDFAFIQITILVGKTEETALESLECIKNLVIEKSWWDTIDPLASKVVGYIVGLYPKTMNTIMQQWITAPDLWLRRTAILHQINYKLKTDSEKLFIFCMLCCHENEFFIQKAIGWALRSYYPHNKKAVQRFLIKNGSKLALLSLKQALKHDTSFYNKLSVSK